jgi:hypothetical protein
VAAAGQQMPNEQAHDITRGKSKGTKVSAYTSKN